MLVLRVGFTCHTSKINFFSKRKRWSSVINETFLQWTNFVELDQVKIENSLDRSDVNENRQGWQYDRNGDLQHPPRPARFNQTKTNHNMHITFSACFFFPADRVTFPGELYDSDTGTGPNFRFIQIGNTFMSATDLSERPGVIQNVFPSLRSSFSLSLQRSTKYLIIQIVLNIDQRREAAAVGNPAAAASALRDERCRWHGSLDYFYVI